MAKLWKLLFISLVLAYLYEAHDYNLRTKNKKGDVFYTFILIVLLACYCGLRTWYNDTVTYLQIYEQTTSLSEFWSSNDASFSSGYGFGLLNCIIKGIGFSSQDFLMFYAFLTIVPYVLFVRKFCCSFVFCVFLMFTTGFYTFTFAAIKQCMATGICLLAVIAALDKKWFKYLLLVGLASLFHPYSVIYLLVPFMMYQPWTKFTYVHIIAFVAAGFGLQSMLDTIVDITTMMGADYTTESFVGEGVNIFRVLVAFVPLVLGFIYRRSLFADSTRSENLMFNLAMLNALIMFVGIFGTANYFARLANYFLPAQVVVLPWMLRKIGGNDGRFLKLCCIVGYLGYFIFENAIIKNFDSVFSQITLWDYLRSH